EAADASPGRSAPVPSAHRVQASDRRAGCFGGAHRGTVNIQDAVVRIFYRAVGLAACFTPPAWSRMRKPFALPDGFPRTEAWLDFGEGKPLMGPQPRTGYQAMRVAPVREAAVVWVNGRRAVAVWCSPYVLDSGSLLEPGPNGIRSQVGNTAMNDMADHRLP